MHFQLIKARYLLVQGCHW